MCVCPSVVSVHRQNTRRIASSIASLFVVSVLFSRAFAVPLRDTETPLEAVYLQTVKGGVP